LTTAVRTPARPPRTDVGHAGVPGLRLVRSEIRKITSTNAWWLFGLASLAITAMSMWANMAEAAGDIARARDTTAVFRVRPGLSATELAEAQARFAQQHDLHLVSVNAAGNIFTSGQFFGLVLVMLLGILVITNEFQYQTATATFLTTPHRSRVVFGKLVAAVGLGFLFWFVSQAISFVSGLLFFHNIALTNSLGEWPVQRALIFNLVAYLLWAVFGFGLGTLIRNQIVALLVAIGAPLLALGLEAAHAGSVAQYLPNQASAALVQGASGGFDQHLLPWWGGGLVLLAYGVVFAVLGAALTTRRDVT
jgi:hypothetical protein